MHPQGQGQRIDYDESAVEVLKLCCSKAAVLKARRVAEENKAKARKAEAEAKARGQAKAQQQAQQQQQQSGGMPMGGMPPGMSPELMSVIMKDPDLMAAMSDPSMMAKMQQVQSNPAMLASDPKLAAIVQKLQKLSGMGGGMGGGMPMGGKGGAPPRGNQPEYDSEDDDEDDDDGPPPLMEIPPGVWPPIAHARR